MIAAFAVLFAIVLTTTTLTALFSFVGLVYLWRKYSKAVSRIEDLTATTYTLYAEKAVLMERNRPIPFGKSSVLH